MSKSEGSQGWTGPFRWYVSPRADGVSVVGWWERRRGYFNLLLLLSGIIAFLSVILISRISSQDLLFSKAVMFGIVQCVLQVTANVWYTGGWVVEVLLKAILRKNLRWFGPAALAVGSLFSLVFVYYIVFVFGAA